MLRHKTTFVLGAGASNEVEMPLGTKLKAQIAELLNVEPDRFRGLLHTNENHSMFEEIERHNRFKSNKQPLLAAARQISAGVAFASSIDNFLEIRKDNPDIALLAKAALVHLILKGERESDLTAKRVGDSLTLKPTAIDGKWYQEFAQLFFEKVGVGDIEDALAHISVIDFNYDRCFEQVIFHAFTGLYNLPRERARELMAKVRIFHPYGTVGTLHRSSPGVPASDFGGDPTGRYLELSEGIRTFTERMTDTTVRDEIRREVTDARTVIFLGCAYHAQNMELIHVSTRADPHAPVTTRLVFGTTFQMSDADKTNVQEKLKAMFSKSMGGGAIEPRVFLADAKCADFLRQYRRTLSAD